MSTSFSSTFANVIVWYSSSNWNLNLLFSLTVFVTPSSVNIMLIILIAEPPPLPPEEPYFLSDLSSIVTSIESVLPSPNLSLVSKRTR